MDLMILLGSVLLVLGFSAYVIILTGERRNGITCMTGMMIGMTNAMMGSTVLGLILGIYFLPNLMLPTMAAVLLGMAVGYFTGKSVSLMAVLDGLMAGVMGGMMGAMIGVMLTPEQFILTTLFFDGVYVIIMMLLVKMIQDETSDLEEELKVVKKSSGFQEEQRRKTILFIMGFVLIVFLVFMTARTFMGNMNTSGRSTIEPKVEMVNGVQEATIVATSYGYEPSNLQLEAGVPTVIKFVADQTAGCSRSVYSKELDFRTLVNYGEESVIDVGTLDAGSYNYSCSMGMYFGKVTVK